MDPDRSIADIDREIIFLQNSLSLYPRSHSRHVTCVSALAGARFSRYLLSQQKEDLDKSIVHHTVAIFLLPPSRASDIPRLLLHLTIALRQRSEMCKQPEGIESCIKYLRYLQTFPIDSFDVPRSLLTTSLIRALGTQIEWGAKNETRGIKEMVILSRELLTFDLSTWGVFPIFAFVSLANAADVAEYRAGIPIELLDEVIECLRDAVKVAPDSEMPDAITSLPLRLVEQL